MGLLDGKKALIFGVANDHSIAWGIAQALHDEGATVGFSSVEMLIEKRVRPLAESIGLDVRRAMRRPGRRADRRASSRSGSGPYGELDILVHALAFAKREDLEGEFVDTSRDGFALALDVSAYSLVALVARGAAPACRRGRRDHDPHLLRRREGRRELQRDGRGQGRARGVRALPGRRPRAARDSRQRDLAPGRSARWPQRASAASSRCTARSPTSPRCGRNITIEDVGGRRSTSPATSRRA